MDGYRALVWKKNKKNQHGQLVSEKARHTDKFLYFNQNDKFSKMLDPFIFALEEVFIR